jgi:hypothetical protein
MEAMQRSSVDLDAKVSQVTATLAQANKLVAAVSDKIKGHMEHSPTHQCAPPLCPSPPLPFSPPCPRAPRGPAAPSPLPYPPSRGLYFPSH